MDYVPICSKEAVQVGCKSVEDIHYFCMTADTQKGHDGQNPSKIYPKIFWGVLKKLISRDQHGRSIMAEVEARSPLLDRYATLIALLLLHFIAQVLNVRRVHFVCWTYLVSDEGEMKQE